MADDETEPERKYYTLKPKAFERINRPVHEEPKASIDVQAMLQQNLAADQNASHGAAALPPIPVTTRHSDPVPPVLPVSRHGLRRKKDYLTALLCAAAVFAIPAFLLRESELALIAIASAFLLFAVVTFWIFWGIMDRY